MTWRTLSIRRWWPRLRDAFVVKALIGYAIAVGTFLQIESWITNDAKIAVPPWFNPLILCLLTVGLFLVVLTAWAESRDTLDASTLSVGSAGELTLEETRPAWLKRLLAGLTWRRSLVGAMIAVLLLASVGAVYVAFQRDPAKGARVAVLPFDVMTPDLENWRGDIVGMLTTNLKGAAGLTLLNGKTVMRAYDQAAADNPEPGESLGEEVARELGATHAVTGTIVGRGREIRISARVIDLRTGEVEEIPVVRGNPDDRFGLADELSLAILRAAFVRQFAQLPNVNLSRATTRVPEAFKAYQGGERSFRRSDWRAARDSFQLAVGEDSTFAQALYRLSLVTGWVDGRTEAKREYSQQAAKFADSLPDPDRSLIQANAALEREDVGAITSLEKLRDRYEDDPEIWYALGDAYYHLGQLGPNGGYPREKFRQAFREALRLDDRLGPAYIHLIEDAFARLDSAEARRLIDSYSAIDEKNQDYRGYELAYDLVWGTPAAHDSAVAALGAAGHRELTRVQNTLTSPEFWEESSLASKALNDPRHPPDVREGARFTQALTHMRRGRLATARQEMLRLWDESTGHRYDAIRTLVIWHLTGYVDVDVNWRAYQELQTWVRQVVDRDGTPWESDVLLWGGVMAQLQDSVNVGRFVGLLQSMGGTPPPPSAPAAEPDSAGRDTTGGAGAGDGGAGGDSAEPSGGEQTSRSDWGVPRRPPEGAVRFAAVPAREREGEPVTSVGDTAVIDAPYALALRGYAALLKGDKAAAIADLEQALPGLKAYCPGSDDCRLHALLQLRLGRVLVEEGRGDEGLAYLRNLDLATDFTVAQLRLGQAYAAKGDTAAAELHYGCFLRWWKDADEDLGFFREAAQAGLDSLRAGRPVPAGAAGRGGTAVPTCPARLAP